MGNKSFSLAVLPLHRFISILIFMYLQKCSVLFVLFLFFVFFLFVFFLFVFLLLFFVVVFFFVLFFFRKTYWHMEINCLGFYKSCNLIFCVSLTTIKMVSTVSLTDLY